MDRFRRPLQARAGHRDDHDRRPLETVYPDIDQPS
jgi:hypothetical protein